MAKNRSLFIQSMTAINGAFSLGYDKHSAKKQTTQPDYSWRIYSFAAKSNLLDTAHNLCEYIKEHYPDTKQVKQITPEQCQEWLDGKAKSGCSIATVEAYKSNLTKLSRVLNHHFGVHTDFATTVKADLISDKTSPKEFALSVDEVARVKDSIVRPCHSSNFFVFSSFTCCRVNSVQKLTAGDLTFLGGDTVKVFIHDDKGGRDREVTVKDREFYSFCHSLVEGKSKGESLFGGIKANSADRWVSRRLKKLGITVPTDKCIGAKRVLKSGNHSVRKAAIQEYYRKQYQNYLDKGYSPDKAKKTAEGDCCVRLGHSRNRADIINIYLGAKS